MILKSRETIVKQYHYQWKMRFVIAIIMLTLAFIGLVVSDMRQNGAWLYWCAMVPVFALLCLFLSWYLRKKQPRLTPKTIWHELLQWLGLGLSVYLISIFVDIGLMGRFEAGLVVLTLLALSTFITGIYVESTFVMIGLMLGLFAWGAAVLVQYIYTIMLPITIGVAALLVWIAKKRS